MWHTIRGLVVGAFAFMVCPCHLPLTLPLILALTAGTAVGGWLAHNSTLIYATSAVLFIGGLVLAGKWLLTDEPEACEIKPKETIHETV